jgi:hypothetical protein
MTDRYRIAFSTMALTGKLPQGDRRWADFNDSFENLTLAPMEIADLIYRGYSFTTWHDGRRSLEHFICGQHIGVDLDTGDERSTFDALMLHEWVRMYASVIYTTPSHTPERPRARVLFLLDKPIDSATGYGEAAKFVISQFDGADVACSDASRFFYGSLDCELMIPANHLPLVHLRHYYNAWKRTQPRQAQPAAPSERKAETSSLFEKLVGEMAMTREGSRNHTLNRVSFLAGKLVAEGGITDTDAESKLLQAALQSGLPDSEAKKTIKRAIDQGKAAH